MNIFMYECGVPNRKDCVWKIFILRWRSDFQPYFRTVSYVYIATKSDLNLKVKLGLWVVWLFLERKSGTHFNKGGRMREMEWRGIGKGTGICWKLMASLPQNKEKTNLSAIFLILPLFLSSLLWLVHWLLRGGSRLSLHVLYCFHIIV
jgi:hypothetical protein